MTLAFLVYRARSGSTLFADRLARHPEIVVLPESRVAPRLQELFSGTAPIPATEIVRFLFAEQKFKDWQLPETKLEAALRQEQSPTWESVFLACVKCYRQHFKPGASIAVFKKAGWYADNLQLLMQSFPQAKAIGLVRDPRAIFNSARRAIHSEKGKPMASNVWRNAREWNRYIRLLASIKQDQPSRIFDFRYEDFLENPTSTLAGACSFLGAPCPDDHGLEELLALRSSSHLVTASTIHLHQKVASPLAPQRARAWKEELNGMQKVLIAVICRVGMKQYGYGGLRF
jgi:hypothetical protein